jgi:glycosyltransferase involved in cell wall biosynthesis
MTLAFPSELAAKEGRVSDFKTWCSLVSQRARENQWIVHSGLFLLILWGFGQLLGGKRAKCIKAFCQVHRTTRLRWMRQLVETHIIANLDAIYREPRPSLGLDLRSFFGNRFLVLKAPAPKGEKGVLLVMFSEMFRLLHSRINLEKLLADYTLVLEPSWSGYCGPDLLDLTREAEKIFVLAAEEGDFAFLRRLGSNLIPIDLGPCDWVDPRAMESYLANPKDFDIVMNSMWASFKRHHVLFRMLASAKKRYKVVLIGEPGLGKTQADIEQLADFYSVADQITILDRISYDEVMDVTCRSRVSVLLSLKEGSNRAVAESIFCNLPVVVLSNHVGGIKKNVVPQTGLLIDERNLEATIIQLLHSSINPREWGMEHISCFKSSAKLNAILRDHALSNGQPWTQDIAGRSNSPESTYIHPYDVERLRPWNAKLTNYLRNG